MTYSQEVKNELCKLSMQKSSCKTCKKAVLYGILMCCRGIRENTITLNIENKAIVDFFTETIIDLTGAIVTVEGPDLRARAAHPFFTISVEDENDVQRIIEYFFTDILQKHTINKELLKKRCCKIAFLRGVYLVCGSIINPQKEYHFELSLSSEKLADRLIELLNEEGFEFKKTVRANSFIIYIKESNQIEDILALLGAVKAAFSLMNMKIEKSMRNNVNRVTNCETANIGKTVNASVKQIEKIRLIRDELGLDALPPELYDVALLRLMNPEASLKELCQLSGDRISKSGLNHRLAKLAEIAEEIIK